MKLVANFDGGYSVTRGLGAGAAVLFDQDGVELATRAQLLRQVTVPVCEYTGLIIALQLAREHAGAMLGQTSVKIFGDAELIIRQVDGRYQCRKPHMIALLGMVRLLEQGFVACEILEFPKAGKHNKRRYLNDRADQLCGECMDAEVQVRMRQ